ncbi:hypothetical protein [Crocosphaera sp. Alani8]|uniref:hypothetical protein n=1 Tax=Crocosphaera sp. Alani8 TaxID=3038952 RepID=UPI00313BCD6B
MHTLTYQEFQRDAEPIFRQVFVGPHDTEPFQSHVEDRIFLYLPWGGDLERNDYWERQLAEALAHAAQSIGDTGSYLAVLWELSKEPVENGYAYIPISELADALFYPSSPHGGSKQVWEQLDIPINLAYCLCSTNGHWGLLTTLDEHGFLGGSSEFMQAVRSYFPDIEKEVLEFLHDVRLEHVHEDKINISWLQQVLSHVYGAKTAQQLIVDSGLV